MKQKMNSLPGYTTGQPAKIFVTSDTFFGRKAAAIRRGFKSVTEMNQHMIDKWNEKISEADHIIHLGNFAWSVDDIEKIYPKLNGSISFMIAEHDQSLLEIIDMQNEIDIIEDQIINVADVVLCHWPLEVWAGKKQGKFHLHGHYSTNIKSDIRHIHRLNVCCDNWNLVPIEIKDTLELLKDFK